MTSISLSHRGKSAESTTYFWAAMIVVIGVFDILSTNTMLAAGFHESNPLIAWVQTHTGAWWVLPKIAVHAGLAWLVLRWPTRRMLRNARIGVAIYALVILNNFSLLFRDGAVPTSI